MQIRNNHQKNLEKNLMHTQGEDDRVKGDPENPSMDKCQVPKDLSLFEDEYRGHKTHPRIL